MIMSVPVSALDMRASEQISFHSIDASASNGEIVTRFTVWGAGPADGIAVASSICSAHTRIVLVEARYRNPTAAALFRNGDYRVSVTVFAEDSAGRDTRSKTVYVTG